MVGNVDVTSKRGTLRLQQAGSQTRPGQTSVISDTSSTFEHSEQLRKQLLETAAEVIAEGGYPRLVESARSFFLA